MGTRQIGTQKTRMSALAHHIYISILSTSFKRLGDIMEYALLVVGSVDVEVEIEARPLPRSDDYDVTSLHERIGGTAVDVAVTCAHLGVRSSLMASIGMDALGLVDLLKHHGIDASHIGMSDTKTGKHVTVSAPGGTSSLLYEGANRHLVQQGLDYNVIASARHLYLAPGPRGLIERLMPHLGEAVVYAHLTPTFPPGMLTEEIDVLVSSSRTACLYTGEGTGLEAVRTLQGMGPRAVIASDAGAAAYCATDAGVSTLSLPSGQEHDASRYESAFVAGVIARYLRTMNAKTSAAYGLACQEEAYNQNKRVLTQTDALTLDERTYQLARLAHE